MYDGQKLAEIVESGLKLVKVGLKQVEGGYFFIGVGKVH